MDTWADLVDQAIADKRFGSARALARALNVDPTAIGRWRYEGGLPRTQQVIRFIEVTGYDPQLCYRLAGIPGPRRRDTTREIGQLVRQLPDAERQRVLDYVRRLKHRAQELRDSLEDSDGQTGVNRRTRRDPEPSPGDRDGDR